MKKDYNWEGGVKLEDHTARKLKILRDYFEQYLRVRCQLPQQTCFKLAIVDGFAGGGRYSRGEPGSPIIFIETLMGLSKEINIHRAANNMAPLEIDCRLILNDQGANVIHILKENLAPVLVAARREAPNLRIGEEYMNKRFEEAYPEIRQSLLNRQFGNALFNLDQCGDRSVDISTIEDILRTFRSGEVFLTFMIKALLAFLNKRDPDALRSRLRHLDIASGDLQSLTPHLSKNEWLGAAEKIVFDVFQGCAPFVSTFALNNPSGWRYWLIHLANQPRARQVYNDVLHDNANDQAHFGRSGLSLNMFAFDPANEGTRYMFEENDRETAKTELAEDIPRLVEGFGDALEVGEFYRSAYNLTPAHSEDIKSAMLLNPDLEVLTPAGNARRKPRAIKPGDTLRFKNQKSFHLTWNKR